jgi:hypothetical protein
MSEGHSFPPGSVIITPEDMWRAIQENRDTSSRIEQGVTELRLLVNPALNEMRDDISALDAREAAHYEKIDKRFRPIEEQSWSARWVPALIASVLATAVGGVVLFLITQAAR